MKLQHATQCTILVTGGTGFVGGHLIALWQKKGYHVIVWSRNKTVAQKKLPSDVQVVESLTSLNNTVVDVVVNLAGAPILGPRWSEKRRKVLLDSRVGLTNILVAWLRERIQKPKLLLSGSAIGFYGVQAPHDDAHLTETSPSQHIFMSTLCQAWEVAAQSVNDVLPVVVLRLGGCAG